MALVCCFCVLRVCVSDSFDCTLKQNGGKKGKKKRLLTLLSVVGCRVLFMATRCRAVIQDVIVVHLFLSPSPSSITEPLCVADKETACYRLARCLKRATTRDFVATAASPALVLYSLWSSDNQVPPAEQWRNGARSFCHAVCVCTAAAGVDYLQAFEAANGAAACVTCAALL